MNEKEKENKIKKEIETELNSKKFTCPECFNELLWITNCFNGYESFCSNCSYYFNGGKRK